MFLWSRLYPCGECALEFQELLRKHPPQTATRAAASLWLCHVHNQVNIRLGKLEFGRPSTPLTWINATPPTSR